MQSYKKSPPATRDQRGREKPSYSTKYIYKKKNRQPMAWISKERKKVGGTVIINYHYFSPLERQKNVGRTGILSNQVGSEIRNKLFQMLPSKNNQKGFAKCFAEFHLKNR